MSGWNCRNTQQQGSEWRWQRRHRIFQCMGIDAVAAVAELRRLAHNVVDVCAERGLSVDIGDIDVRFDQVARMGLTADNGMRQRDLVRSAVRLAREVDARCRRAMVATN